MSTRIAPKIPRFKEFLQQQGSLEVVAPPEVKPVNHTLRNLAALSFVGAITVGAVVGNKHPEIMNIGHSTVRVVGDKTHQPSEANLVFYRQMADRYLAQGHSPRNVNIVVNNDNINLTKPPMTYVPVPKTLFGALARSNEACEIVGIQRRASNLQRTLFGGNSKTRYQVLVASVIHQHGHCLLSPFLETNMMSPSDLVGSVQNSDEKLALWHLGTTYIKMVGSSFSDVLSTMLIEQRDGPGATRELVDRMISFRKNGADSYNTVTALLEAQSFMKKNSRELHESSDAEIVAKALEFALLGSAKQILLLDNRKSQDARTASGSENLLDVRALAQHPAFMGQIDRAIVKASEALSSFQKHSNGQPVKLPENLKERIVRQITLGNSRNPDDQVKHSAISAQPSEDSPRPRKYLPG